MFKEALKQMTVAIRLLILLTIITGFVYPIVVTGLAQWLFPKQANGSLIEKNGQLMGSLFIGQSFTSPNYFWGRPSETVPYPYNGAASLGSNSGPSNHDFLTTVEARIQHLKSFNEQTNDLIPVDLVTASASGLDPEISPFAAFYQVTRVAKARHLPEVQVNALVQRQIKGRSWGLLGEPRINVLQLNLALDESK